MLTQRCQMMSYLCDRDRLFASRRAIFFSPHRTCKAIWIIFHSLLQGVGDFCAKWDKVLNYLEQMERKLGC